MITELVKFKVLETTTDELLISKADILNSFQKKYDGFIDAELVKDTNDNLWFIIYHYESMEKLKMIGEQMRAHKIFDEFIPVVVPESLSVTYYEQVKRW